MGQSWYKQCLPRVSEVREVIPQLRATLGQVKGIKSVRIFGSIAEHFNNPNHRVKDIDVIAVTPFHSEDLLAITNETLSTRLDCLEEQGIDVEAVQFSKGFTRVACQYPLDFWTLSKDRKLLHWGPFSTTKEESQEVKSEAEEFASKKAGFNLSKLTKASDEKLGHWYESFHSFLQRQFDNMPTGWYQSEEQDIKSIISQSIVI